MPKKSQYEIVLTLKEPEKIMEFMYSYLTRGEFCEYFKVSSTFKRYYRFFTNKFPETEESKYDAFIHAVVNTMKTLGSLEGYVDFLNKKFGKFSSRYQETTEEEQKSMNIGDLINELLKLKAMPYKIHDIKNYVSYKIFEKNGKKGLKIVFNAVK